jgi:hypothetical protein
MIARLLACLALLSACDDAEPDATPTLELGTGEWRFEPLTPEQRVQLVAGTQGGFHVWLSMRAQGFDGDRLRMKLTLRSSGSSPLSGSDLELMFEPAEDGWLEFEGWPAQLLAPWCGIEQPLAIEVTLSDRAGHSAAASISVVPTAPATGFSQTCAAP